jgi:hypothetical protein
MAILAMLGHGRDARGTSPLPGDPAPNIDYRQFHSSRLVGEAQKYSPEHSSAISVRIHLVCTRFQKLARLR